MGKMRKVTMRGNSPGVTLPRDYLAEVGVDLGEHVDVSLTDGKIVVRPLRITPATADAETG